MILQINLLYFANKPILIIIYILVVDIDIGPLVILWK